MVNSLDSGSLEAANPPWHTRAPDDVLSALSATRDGLSTDEAQKRLAQRGANVLDKKGGASVLELIWRQINNPLIWVLIGCAVIAMLVDPADGIKNGLVILAVVVINTLIGFFQEFRPAAPSRRLASLVPESATVHPRRGAPHRGRHRAGPRRRGGARLRRQGAGRPAPARR